MSGLPKTSLAGSDKIYFFRPTKGTRTVPTWLKIRFIRASRFGMQPFLYTTHTHTHTQTHIILITNSYLSNFMIDKVNGLQLVTTFDKKQLYQDQKGGYLTLS